MLKEASTSFGDTNRSTPGKRSSRSMDFRRNGQQPHCVDHDTVKARSDRSMKWFTAMLLAVILTPHARAAQQYEWALVAHGERKKGAYLVLSLITQEMELIPTESLDQCEAIGKEIMNGGKLSKFLKGYRCIHGLL